MEFVESLEGFKAIAAGREAVLAVAIRSDPESARSMVGALDPSLSKSTLTRTLARELASKDPAVAKAWADSLTSPHDRRAAFAGLALSFSKTDPRAAAAAFDQINWNLKNVESITTYEPGGREAWEPVPKIPWRLRRPL